MCRGFTLSVQSGSQGCAILKEELEKEESGSSGQREQVKETTGHLHEPC